MTSQLVETVFLFVNSRAGGMVGEEILQRVPEYFPVEGLEGERIVLRSFSLTGEGTRGKKAGFSELKKLIGDGISPVRVVAAGGDGTIKWVVSEAKAHDVDPARDLLLGILPLGTGNDFSRSTGWGGTFPRGLLRGNLENLSTLVRSWCAASDKPHDVWEVEIGVDQDIGSICRVAQVGTAKRSVDMDKLSVRETMIMYFSIGTDSKVGIGFDKHRTSYRLCNFLVYMWEGLKKSMPCRMKHRVADVVHGLYHGSSSRGPVIFEDVEDASSPSLLSTPQMLVIANITSFGGGSACLWNAASRLGVSKTIDNGLMCSEQNPGDGKLEVVTVRNLPTVVLDPLTRRLNALGPRRVFSGAPLFMAFKDGEDEDLLTYCQVDGEFFKLVNPKFVRVKHLLSLRVLYNTDVSGSQSTNFSDSSESDSSSGEACFGDRSWWSMVSGASAREARWLRANVDSD